MNTVTARIGGLFGIASALVIIPAYLVGSPEAPDTTAEAQGYFDSVSSFLTANGTLALLHVLFALVFIGVLVSLLHAAAGPSAAVYIAAIGGAVFLTMTAAGIAAEVAVPAAIVQFDNVTMTDLTQPFLALAIWLYNFSHIGSTALIFAVAVVVWSTGLLPKWSVALAVLGIPTALHLWLGLPSAYAMIIWLALTGLLLLVLSPAQAPVESVEV